MGRRNHLWLIGSLAALNEVAQAVLLGRDGLARRQGTLTPSPVLSFDTIPDLVTCEPATIAWFYAGPPINMTLSITNDGVEQVTAPPVGTSTSTSTPPPLTNARRQAASTSIDVVINTKINPDSLTFRWPSVNITSGTYQFRASIASQNFVSRSTSFNIRQGSDTSCLQSSSTATTTGIPSNTAINAPVSSTSKSRNVGTIVGIVLGVLALFIVVILAYMRIRGKGKKRFGFSKDVGRKWNGLSSVDSRNALAAHLNDQEPRLAAAKRRNYSRGSSLGTVVASHSKEAVGGGASEEKVGSSSYSRKNSIASYDSSHVMALSTLPTLHHRDRDDVYNPRHQDPYPPAASATVARRTSVDRKSGRSRSQPYLDPIESDNTVSRSSSIGGTSFTHTPAGPSEFYPSSSPSHPPSPTPPLSAEAKKANRQSFGRKRKPVPAYDPNAEIPSVPSPTPQSPIHMDYEYGHDARSSPSHQSHATTPDMITYSPAQTSTALGHYTTRNAAAAQATAEDGSETLGHKSSFGPAGVEGKPLHYLMPDLPMSGQTGSFSSHSQR